MENTPAQDCCRAANFKNPHFILMLTGMLLLAGIVVVSMLREKIVNPSQNQVTVAGRGKVEYKPDTATITLGVQVDKAPNAENALSQLNEKMNQIVAEEVALGIAQEKIQTQNYSLSPQYDYVNGRSFVSGYNANQQLSIKVEGIGENTETLGKAISVASQNGANQVSGIKFETTNIEALKLQARTLAIQDAQAKSKSMSKTAGVKLGKVLGWYENVLQSPDMGEYPQPYGFGAGGDMTNAKVALPQIPSGTQEIVIELNLNYEVK